MCNPKGKNLKTRVHVYLSGKVQGVFFRARIMERAIRLGVTGWVQNTSDCRVEAVIEGEEDTVNALVDFCRRGPKGAVVTGIDLIGQLFTGEFTDFRIRHQNSV
jgi:acylphosphatase